MSEAKGNVLKHFTEEQISLSPNSAFLTPGLLYYIYILYTYYTYRINQVPVCHLIMSDVLCVVHTSTIVLCGGEIVESLGALTVTQNPTS